MKYKLWSLLIIIILAKIFFAFSGNAVDVAMPDFLDRLSVYPKQLFIEVNIPERALYLYQIYNEQQYVLKKFPCTVGTMEYQTPEGQFSAPAFRWNPGWIPPQSKWAENLQEVDPTANSPLGCAALTVDWEKAILIHGTQNKADIGKPASHGCIRLSNNNMAELLSYLQDNMPNTLGKSDVEGYRQNADLSYWGYFRKPLLVKLVYRRLEQNGAQVVFYPDIYTKGHYELPLTQSKDLLVEHRLITPENLYLAQARGLAGQEYLSKIPYPYRGISKERKYYASLKVKMLTWYLNSYQKVSRIDKMPVAAALRS